MCESEFPGLILPKNKCQTIFRLKIKWQLEIPLGKFYVLNSQIDLKYKNTIGEDCLKLERTFIEDLCLKGN